METVEKWGSYRPSKGHCGYSPGHSLHKVISFSDFSREIRNLELRAKFLDFYLKKNFFLSHPQHVEVPGPRMEPMPQQPPEPLQ